MGIKNVLVTGDRGYIGSVLTGILLEKGYAVRGYDVGYFADCLLRPVATSYPCITKDIRDVSESDLEGVDAIIHLAGLSNDPLGELRPGLTEEINFRGTMELARLARNAGVSRFVYQPCPSGLHCGPEHDVACLGRSRPAGLPAGIGWIDADLLSLQGGARKAIEAFAPECCVHLAWAGLPDYSLGRCLENLCAGAALFEFLRGIGCRKIIGAGSCWEYGARTGAVAESSPGLDVNLFATHKNALREIGQSLLRGSDCQFIWARIFFVYGLKQRPTSLIPSAIRSLKCAQTPRIGTPMAVNDFVHVQDVASALQCLVESAHAQGIYNIGSGRPASVAQVVNEIARQTGQSRSRPVGTNHRLRSKKCHRLRLRASPTSREPTPNPWGWKKKPWRSVRKMPWPS